MSKKVTTITAPRSTGPQPNATLGDAVNYVKADPGGLISALRWLGGFFAALFRPAQKRP